MKNNNFLKIFGKKVKKQRKVLRVSLKELADKTQIRKEYLKKIENGQAVGLRLSHYIKIIEVLKIK